jgi:predicted alpha/beta hydrolase
MFLLWHAFMPLVARIFGYFPGERLRLLEDLPLGVALEWAARRKPDFWWHLQRPDGTPDDSLIRTLLDRFESIRANTIALRFSDDPFATEEATERILGLYKNATVHRLVLDKSDGDGREIGHFGFLALGFVQLFGHVFAANSF